MAGWRRVLRTSVFYTVTTASKDSCSEAQAGGVDLCGTGVDEDCDMTIDEGLRILAMVALWARVPAEVRVPSSALRTAPRPYVGRGGSTRC